MSVHVFTSVTSNYIPKARVLAESVKRFHPDFVFHLVLVDAVPSWFQIEGEPFDSLLTLRDLGFKDVKQWLFSHSVVEACTGVKGAAFTKLLSKRNCSAVIYFDPDIVVLSSADSLLSEFGTASILLTPHLTEPEQTLEAIYDNEFSVLQHGIYNLGFLGVKNSPAGRRFAEWWADRLYSFCYDDIPRGIFTDQKWADMAPAYFDEVRVLRGPEYNVCTWNLTHRDVKGSFRSGFMVNGRPIVFYHFSGLDSGAQEAMLQKYGSKMPALHELREWYLAECDSKGQASLGKIAWNYATFDNGVTIDAAHRKLYRDRGDLQDAFPDPYATENVSCSYFHWFQADGKLLKKATSRLSPLKFDAARIYSPLGRRSQPDYRIFLSVCGAQCELALRSAIDLRSKSFRADALYALGSEAELADLFKDTDLRNSFHLIRLPEPANHDHAFAAAAGEFGLEMDFAFVTPAVAVCELWDIRLAWTAGRVPGVGTVSPINGSEAFTSLGLVTAGLGDVDQIDAACYARSCFANPEIPSFGSQCVYVNHQVLLETGPVATRQDLATKAARFRWSHVLADHIYTGVAERGFTVLGKTAPPAALACLRDSLIGFTQDSSGVAVTTVRRQLHVMHSWGGGLEHWVREYCLADTEHRNFILKSTGSWGAFGMELRLYDSINDEEPIQQWILNPSIKHTAGTHSGYRAAIAEIVHRYSIDAVLISSMVGHSLEVLGTGLATLMICHDFYPFCPALNITFEDRICQSCGPGDLQRCTAENVHNRFFRNVPPSEWTELRAQYSEALILNRVRMIAPSASVQKQYALLMPELAAHFEVISHGTQPFGSDEIQLEFQSNRRLRVVILGTLAPHKGIALLEKILPELLTFADLYLVGCGDSGHRFGLRGVTVIQEYKWAELPELLRPITPDLGLLLSVVPETFSYTLQELFELGIPPVATALGSFADRIDDGINGFLVEPTPESVLKCLRGVAKDRSPLARISQFLRRHPPRRTEEMLADYEAVLALPNISERAYFAAAQLSVWGKPVEHYVQLMWKSASSDFHEDFSVIVLTRTTEMATACLPIPRQPSGITELRLDLGDTPGFIILFRLQLVDDTGQTIWSWQSGESPLVGPAPDLFWVGGSPGSLIYICGRDPHFTLPIPSAQLLGLQNGGMLQIEMAYPSQNEATMAALRHLLPGAHKATVREHLNPVTPSVQTARAAQRPGLGMERLLQQLTAARERVDDIERSLSWRITMPLRVIWGLILNTLYLLRFKSHGK